MGRLVVSLVSSWGHAPHLSVASQRQLRPLKPGRIAVYIGCGNTGRGRTYSLFAWYRLLPFFSFVLFHGAAPSHRTVVLPLGVVAPKHECTACSFSSSESVCDST